MTFLLSLGDLARIWSDKGNYRVDGAVDKFSAE